MRNDLSRREFSKLTSAALAGIAAGTWAGCSTSAPKEAKAAADLHVCRGLNACNSQGAEGKNACAGQGTCATVHHGCAQQNDCKHQGGCGEAPGENDCKTKGGCEVPLGGDMWAKARANFEERMKAQGKTVGAAPAAK
jgi:hypothetical protein